MENKDKLIESAQELKKGLDLLSRERKVVMPHNKAFDHVDRLRVKVDEIINLAETV
jgi:sugar-specific transcriptional regulator TrmB